MKIFFLALIFSFHQIGYSIPLQEKQSCDAAIVNNNINAADICTPWLKYALNENDLEQKAAASLDYAMALELGKDNVGSEKYYREAVEYAVKNGKDIAIATCSGAAAQYYYKKKDFVSTLQMLSLSIASFTSKFGAKHFLTLNQRILQADTKRLAGDYLGALVAADSVLDAIPTAAIQTVPGVAHLFSIRASSLEKTGRTKEALASYFQAAQLMEKFDTVAALVFWGNLKAALNDSGLAKDTAAVDARITYLSGLNGAHRNLLSPRISLVFDESSVRQ